MGDTSICIQSGGSRLLEASDPHVFCGKSYRLGGDRIIISVVQMAGNRISDYLWSAEPDLSNSDRLEKKEPCLCFNHAVHFWCSPSGVRNGFLVGDI